MLTPRLVSAEHVRDFILRLRFADGTEGEVDLSSEIWGEVFLPLQDPEVFRQFTLDHELNTITWPTGADFAPEFLYERATG
jgi:hypothetical protein